MKNIYKEYHELRDAPDKSSHIKCRIWYDTGVGYYASFQPIQMENKGTYNVESFIAYTGYKTKILEIKRRSSKRDNEAINLFKEHKHKILNKIALDGYIIKGYDYNIT